MLAVFLDSETSGRDYKKHAILEIAYKIVNLNTGKEEAQYQRIILQDIDTWRKSDPESLKIHGLTWEMIKGGTPISQVKEEIIASFNAHRIKGKKACIICQNPSFDHGFFAQIVDLTTQSKLNWPYHWLDLASMFYAIKVKEGAKKIALSKDAIAKSFNLPEKKRPHRAMNGVDHLLLCYKHLLGFSRKD